MDKNTKSDCYPTPCCAVEEKPYKPPTIEESALDDIKRQAIAIERNNKKLEFVRQFPTATKWLDTNGFSIYGN